MDHDALGRVVRDAWVVQQDEMYGLPATFWKQVKKTGGCWLWTGHLNKGYGRTRRKGKKILCHRLVFEATRGPIPADLLVCHHCDVKNCVNPTHLFLGTDKDNSDDKWAKNRGATTACAVYGDRHGSKTCPDRISRGEKHSSVMKIKVARGQAAGGSKLTEDEVRFIRATFTGAYGEKQALARRFNVSHSTIILILQGKTWATLANLPEDINGS